MVPITEAGYYEIQVDGPGYISTRQSLSIDCHPADCDTCAPSIMIPLSPVLGENQLRLTLGGEHNLENLALYAVYRDSMISCITTPDQTTDCTGIERVTGANGQGVETITFNQPSDDTPAVYTIFLEWTAPAGQEEETLAGTKAFVSLSDGSTTEEIKMKSSEYGGERHWLAGCLLLSGSHNDPAYQLRPLNAYFSVRPDIEVPDLCLETFGLQPNSITWEGQCVQDSESRVFPVAFGQTSYNTPEYCIAKCKSHEYLYAGVEYISECYCSNNEPTRDLILNDSECNKKCPGDSSKYCGGDWAMNVYETGYEDGMPLPSGHRCECSYHLGGCKVSVAAPAGYSCKCKYEGWWSCDASLRLCDPEEECPADCTSKSCCEVGQGNCGGYWL